MQTASPYFRDFARAQIKTAAAFALCQLPTPDGSRVASQFILPDLSSIRLIRNQDLSSDSCSFAFPDNSHNFSPLNRSSNYGAAFAPGKIDNKFAVFMGFRGSNFTAKDSFSFNDKSMLLKFTGFCETDSNMSSPNGNAKTVSLLDLNKQFRFPVYDTFPHVLYGNQQLSYFDPNYNLKNTTNDLQTWECDAKMFTHSTNDLIYGSSHVDPAVYIDVTGGANPQGTPLVSSAYTFDYQNGIVYLNNPVPSQTIVSLAGNPTYMSPENMIYHLLVNYANWDKNFLNLNPSGVLLPQYQCDNKVMWECLKDIANLTNPRFLPWVIWTDEAGVLNFYETRIDGPPVKTYLDEKEIFSQNIEFSSRSLRTVVRADATVTTLSGDQPITSLAYNVKSINDYGQTEPLTISPDITKNVRHLSIPQAISYLNLLTASVLSQVSRPDLTLQLEVWPDPSLQISDKIRVRSKKTGIDRLFLITGIEEDADPSGSYKQKLTVDEYYDSVNYMMGIPAGVSSTGQASTLQVPPPAVSLIDSIRIGTGVGMFAFQGGQYSSDRMTGDQIVPIWDVTQSYSGVHFDVYLNSLPATSNPSRNAGGSTPQYSYTNLPPGYGWNAERNSSNQTVYYVQNDNNGNVLYVGPDSVFYKYPQHSAQYDYRIRPSDLSYTWTPTGNIALATALGGSQSYIGQAATVYLWSWWYLNLDSDLGSGKYNRLVQRVNMTSYGMAPSGGIPLPYITPGPSVIPMPATSGQWVVSSWHGAPGPDYTATVNRSYLYGNIVVGATDTTRPPGGFEFCQPFQGDLTKLGVGFGAQLVGRPHHYVGYEKVTRGHYCVYVVNSNGATQFLRLPFDLYL